MEVRLALEGSDERDVRATVPPGTSLHDLLATAGGATVGPTVWVDGQPVDGDTDATLAPLADGCTVATHPTGRLVIHTGSGEAACPDPTGWRVTVVAGPDSGRSRHVGPGCTISVGRSADNDLVIRSDTVSSHHLTLATTTDELVVTDLQSHNGTWMDADPLPPHHATPITPPATLRAGATVLHVATAPPCEAPRGHDLAGPTRTVHRPPRPTPPAPPAPVVAPGGPDLRRAAPALRWAGILAPVAMGAAMVAMTGSLRFGLFALLSPVMVIGNWWSSRRHERRAGRAASRLRIADQDRFRGDLAAAADDERRRRDATLPDLATIARRATEPSRRLWERRPHHDDAFVLRVGSADLDWAPDLVPPDRSTTIDPSDETAAVQHLPTLPLPLDLRTHRVVGITGEPAVRTGLARSLVVQASVLHGPADLAVTVDLGPEAAADWDWVKWLPHLQVDEDDHGGHRVELRVVDGAASARSGADGERRRDTRRPRTDVERLAIVLADHHDQLPASCSMVVRATRDFTGHILRPQPAAAEEVLLATIGVPGARQVARALARCRDPERAHGASRLPAAVALADLDLDPVAADAPIRDRLSTPLGRDADGPVEVDLVADGPHALVAGTTGSGKSELLRTLVTGLATRHTPRDVVFVLVDYKGGSAFRDCADLPHTVGLVTDLDDHLGARALRSLRAELRHRERRLAAAGADDLASCSGRRHLDDDLPRLVVVVDEFATLAAELPDFLDALVGIAQRGRSLGLHLVLATQRPRGCVDADIRANTNLRIALRVQDEGDARDVIDDPRPALIDRSRPGQAWMRRGHEDLQQLQVALAGAPPARSGMPARVAPFRLGSVDRTAPASDDRVDHLPVLVAACRQRADDLGIPPPRRPWLPMLPERIPLEDLLPAGGVGAVVLGLADLPDEQDQRPATWDLRSGHLLVCGRRGSGTTTALETIAAGFAIGHDADRVHLHVVDGGTGRWKPARDLPHVGSVIDGHAPDDVLALLDWLLAEVARRRRGTAPPPAHQVLLVDGLTTLLDNDDPRGSAAVAARLGGLLDDGPDVGVTVAAATERLGGLPARVRSGFTRRLVLDVDDRDLALLGVDARALPRPLPGRAIDADDATVIQVAEPMSHDRLVGLAGPPAGSDRRPHRLLGLPDQISLEELPTSSGRHTMVLPVGMGRDGVAAEVRLRAGDHAVIAGPPRSGRTTALQVISTLVRRARPETRQVALCAEDVSSLHGWPSLDASGSPDGLRQVLDAVGADDRRWLVLVDDLRRWGDLEVLAGLAERVDDVTLVVAGRPDDLRGTFGGWLRTVRSSRSGILLQPDLALDGDLLGVRLPRRLSTPLGPGRGFVVDGGDATLAQLAGPPAHPDPGDLAEHDPT